MPFFDKFLPTCIVKSCVVSGIAIGVFLACISAGEGAGVVGATGIKANPSASQCDAGYDQIDYDSVVFNTTGGATPGAAWQDGLFHISGDFTAYSSSKGSGYARLMVNGSMVEQYCFDMNGFWDTQSFSTYLMLDQGDTVTLEVDSPGTYNAYSGKFSNFNMIGFNTINGQSAASGIKAKPSASQCDAGYDQIDYDSVVFNTTGGAAPGVAWQNGLFHISGDFTAYSSGDGYGHARLMVNGSMVEQYCFDMNGYWDTQSFSTYLLLGEGDIVTLEVDSPGSCNAMSGDFSNFNMIGFNTINGQSVVSGIKAKPSASQCDAGYDQIDFDTVVFDTTGGATPGVAWQDGLFHISGDFTAGSSGEGLGYARLMVNGVMVEQYCFDMNPLWDTQSFSTYLTLSEGDIVTLEVDSPGSYNTYVGEYANFTMIGFNTIPEPGSIVLLFCGLAVTLLYRRCRR